MNPREKKLVVGIGALLAVGLVLKVIVPKWLKPMFDFDTRIAELTGRRAAQDPALRRIDAAFDKYQTYVARTGGNDEKQVGDEFNRTMNELLLESHLTALKLTPKEASPDRKTGLVTKSYSFQAQGELKNAVMFLKTFYEKPYVARFKDVKIEPIKVRGNATNDSVTLKGSIDVLVPPRPDIEVPYDQDRPAPEVKRIKDKAYALIYERDPFNPPAKVEPSPPVVIVERDPVEPLVVPPAPLPSGMRDPQGAQKVINMTVVGEEEEVLVVNKASKQREVIGKGKDLDGGKLLMVHPLGALVRRMDAGQEREFLYPIGELLADSVRIDQAQKHPELRTIGRYFLKQERLKRQAEEAAAAQEAAAREAAAREAAGGMQDGEGPGPTEDANGLMGPPAELGGSTPFSPPEFDPATNAVMGPPAVDSVSMGMDQPVLLQVGPPAELAGPMPKPGKSNSPGNRPSRRGSVKRPAGSN